MSPAKNKELQDFFNDTLKKGYIVSSKFSIASPVFFIKKKDGKLHLIQDYQKLNNVIIQNRYPLFLASDIINKLQETKIFFKFNVH